MEGVKAGISGVSLVLPSSRSRRTELATGAVGAERTNRRDYTSARQTVLAGLCTP